MIKDCEFITSCGFVHYLAETKGYNVSKGCPKNRKDTCGRYMEGRGLDDGIGTRIHRVDSVLTEEKLLSSDEIQICVNMEPEQKPETGGAPREHEFFCQEPSDIYMRLLDEEMGDPRSVAGRQALRDLRNNGGWSPTIDARDARK